MPSPLRPDDIGRSVTASTGRQIAGVPSGSVKGTLVKLTFYQGSMTGQPIEGMEFTLKVGQQLIELGMPGWITDISVDNEQRS